MKDDGAPCTASWSNGVCNGGRILVAIIEGRVDIGDIPFRVFEHRRARRERLRQTKFAREIADLAIINGGSIGRCGARIGIATIDITLEICASGGTELAERTASKIWVVMAKKIECRAATTASSAACSSSLSSMNVIHQPIADSERTQRSYLR